MIFELPQLNGTESVQELVEHVAKLQKMVMFMMNGKLSSDNIRANSIVAEKLDVSELSAISANLGKMTAGEVYGAYIATAEGTYPRIEFDSDNNLLKASFDGVSYIAMRPIGGSTPNLYFFQSSKAASIFFDFGNLNILTSQGINIGGAIGTNIQKLQVDGMVRFGTLSQADSAASTVAGVNFVLNELLSKLRAMGILAP